MPSLQPQSLQDSGDAPIGGAEGPAVWPWFSVPPRVALLPARHHARCPSSFLGTGRSQPLGQAHNRHLILEYSGIPKQCPGSTGHGNRERRVLSACHSPISSPQPRLAGAPGGCLAVLRGQRACSLGRMCLGWTWPGACPCPRDPGGGSGFPFTKQISSFRVTEASAHTLGSAAVPSSASFGQPPPGLRDGPRCPEMWHTHQQLLPAFPFSAPRLSVMTPVPS